ncbi:MAG: helix-turn-helix transcriptional regulator [bacterium]|nr:helix-turn-helix transcriptional regulator [bacterium]
MDMGELGARIKTARQAIGITMEVLSEVMGFAKSNVSLVENGHQRPTLNYFRVLYEKYDVDLNYLFSGEGEIFRQGTARARKKEPTAADSALEEMLYMVENLEMVRFAMLSYYIGFKTQNKSVIKELLGEEAKG